MKEIEIKDDSGTGKTLMCEKHYREFLPKIAIASKNKVSIIISNTKQKGCVQCARQKSGNSPWEGVMFKIWTGCNKNESEIKKAKLN